MIKRQKQIAALIISVSFLSVSFYNSAIASPVPSITSISSLKANIQNGKEVYMTCALCHSPQGWGTTNGYYPQLSGQHSSVLIKQLIDIQLGNRDVPTMIPFSNALFYQGHQNVADVVHYISTLPMNPKNGVGKGDNLSTGKNLYTKHCESCHGKNAEGVKEKHYPLLQGQHYQYLLRQMKWIKNGNRKNGDAEMAKTISSYSNQDMEAVSDYISRIRPPKKMLAKSIEWKNPDFDSNFKSAPWQRHEKKDESR